jgi:hypothetical protein
VLEGFGRRLAEGHDTFFASFAQNPNQHVLEIRCAEIEAYQLSYAQSGTIDELENSLVSSSQGSGNIRAIEESFHLLFFESGRDLLLEPRRGYTAGRVLREPSLADEKAEKSSECRQLPGNGRTSRASVVELGKKAPKRKRIHLFRPEPFGRYTPFFGEKTEELLEVGAVAFDGVRRKAATVLEVVEELV